MSQFSAAEPRIVAAPEVSVVVIFKDAEDFLAEAIESVCAQTFPAWELLLVDDGSTDASTAIARGHAEQDSGRVRYFEHPGHVNLGMSATRNLGVSRARGELVTFLDADDVLVPTALEEAVAILRAHPRVGMVYGQVEAARLRFLRWLVAYLEDEGLAGSDAWRQARKELRRYSRTGRLLARVTAARRPA